MAYLILEQTYEYNKLMSEEKPIMAGAVAALRGATLGASDFALKQTGLLTEQELQDLQAANPTISIVGEIAGTVAPTLLSGGAGLAGRAAVSKLMAQGMAKEAAEAAVAKMVERSTLKFCQVFIE